MNSLAKTSVSTDPLSTFDSVMLVAWLDNEGNFFLLSYCKEMKSINNLNRSINRQNIEIVRLLYQTLLIALVPIEYWLKTKPKECGMLTRR